MGEENFWKTSSILKDFSRWAGCQLQRVSVFLHSKPL
uniref:Uncharacterized protein n=1 Tax=Anguilla anguilla TaxID=7936 RepID=A0A0E9VID1_ANGAN